MTNIKVGRGWGRPRKISKDQFRKSETNITRLAKRREERRKAREMK